METLMKLRDYIVEQGFKIDLIVWKRCMVMKEDAIDESLKQT